jgi:hypothetical protein
VRVAVAGQAASTPAPPPTPTPVRTAALPGAARSMGRWEAGFAILRGPPR